MRELPTHEEIIEAIKLDLDEYINVDGFTFTQASAKIIEEEWQNINKSKTIKYSYLIILALEGIARKGLPDFLYEKLDFNFDDLFDPENVQFNQLKQDFEVYLIKNKEEFDVVETSVDVRSRIDYILNQKP
ncbi:hypothetical protein [Enterococcus sp. AZ196]|uniref:hypothetical protein n=1 Tax=Enterococcus sp. AZ196 TaxID=2774659 RepID=UPI003D2A67DA